MGFSSAEYYRNRQAAIRKGTWPRLWSDPKPVHAHIRQLVAAGLEMTQIERLAGVPGMAVRRQMKGRRTRRIRTYLAIAILAVPTDPTAWPPEYREKKSILARREVEVLRLVAVGMSSPEIGMQLGISKHTVDDYIGRAREALGAYDRTDAVSRANARGLLDAPSTSELKSA